MAYVPIVYSFLTIQLYNYFPTSASLWISESENLKKWTRNSIYVGYFPASRTSLTRRTVCLNIRPAGCEIRNPIFASGLKNPFACFLYWRSPVVSLFGLEHVCLRDNRLLMANAQNIQANGVRHSEAHIYDILTRQIYSTTSS